MLRIIALEQFRKEFKDFPDSTKEDLSSLIEQFISGEKLAKNDLKIFKIDKNIKILEFRTKDYFGNWRVISTICKGDILLLVYAFHKKTQQLPGKDKNIIKPRIKRVQL